MLIGLQILIKSILNDFTRKQLVYIYKCEVSSVYSASWLDQSNEHH